MLKRGFLVPGRTGTLSWSMGGEPMGSISFATSREGLQLSYTVGGGDDERERVEERILFSFTAPHLGGLRHWLLCPRCGRRCIVLYGGRRFRCRACYRLAYQSQNEAPMWRSLAQAQKLRQRLGGSGAMDELFPPRPKGMHWRTYAKHVRRAERLEGRVEALETVFLGKLAARWLG